MPLAQTIENKVEAAFRRRELFEQSRTLMQEWVDYILPDKTNFWVYILR